jgi:hypothetical protein
MTENVGQNQADQQLESSDAAAAVETKNPLEAALAQGQQGTVDQSDVILTFLNSQVLILTAEDPEKDPDANLEPVALTGPNDEPMIAVFSDPSRVPAELGEQAPYGVGVQGATVIKSVGDGVGIMLNPGFELGFMVDFEGVKAIRNDFRPAEEVEAILAQQQSQEGRTGQAAQPTSASDAHPVRPTIDPAGF